MMPNLQILRFLAAGLVLVSHIQHEALKGYFLDNAAYQPWTAIYFAGGVDIFFVISGFIMYAIAHGEFGKPGAAKKFFLRRLVRIAPPYWIFTTAMIGAAVVFSHHVTHSVLAPDHILASYFFIPYDNPYGKPYPLLMLGWTLNYEMFFYLVFGSALLFRKKIGMALIFGCIGMLGLLGGAGKLPALPLSFWSNPIVFEFLFGILLAAVKGRNIRIPRAAGWSCVAIGFLAMYVLKQAGIAEHFWALRALWMGLPALLICAGVVLVPDDGRAPGRIRAPLVLCGDASYAIYLTHPFTLNAVALIWARAGFSTPWVYVAVASVLSIIVGVAIHLLIERPMTKYLNGVVDRRLLGKLASVPQPG